METKTQEHTLHLIGREPQSGRIFNSRLVANDAWLQECGIAIEHETHGFNVRGNPQMDLQELQSLGVDVEKSLQSLAFILENGKLYKEMDEDKNQNPELRKDPMRHEGLEKLQYGTALRILEALAAEGLLWFGIEASGRESDLWKRNPYVTPHKREGAVEAHEVVILLEGKRKTVESNVACCATLHCQERIGVEVKGKQYWIPESSPLIVSCLSTEGLLSNDDPLTFLCNPAYLELMENFPEEAKELYKEQAGDFFHYQSQFEDQDYYDIEGFWMDSPKNLNNLIDKKGAAIELEEATRKAMVTQIKPLILLTAPELGNGSWIENIYLQSLALNAGHLEFTAHVTQSGQITTVHWKDGKGKVIQT